MIVPAKPQLACQRAAHITLIPLPHILAQLMRMRRELLQDAETSNVSKLRFYVALGSLIWWVIVWCVCAIGFTQLYTTSSTSYFRKPRLTKTDFVTIGENHNQQYVSRL